MPSNPTRVEPLPESEWDEETAKLLNGLRHGGKLFNIFATLARHPDLLRRWLVFGNHILSKSELPARHREIAILRTGWLCKAEYEWGHHVAIGKHAGLSDDDIQRCAAGPDSSNGDPFETALLRAVDELHKDSRIGDSTWAALSQHYSTRQLMDLVFTVGQYKLVSMALNTLGVQLEEGFTGWPREAQS